MKLFLPGAGARMIPSLRCLPVVDELIVSLHDPGAPGNFLADKSYRLPRFDHPDFLAGVSEIHAREKFDACIPVLDSALLAFTKPEADAFAGRFVIAMSPKQTVQIAVDKMKVRDLFLQCGLKTPEAWTLPEFQRMQRRPFPSFLKPRFAEVRDFGQGIYRRLDDQADVDYWALKLGGLAESHIVQPFLIGREINVNFFCDADGEVRSVVPLERLAGEPGCAITKGEILDDARFDPIVKKLAAAVRLWGSNELQVMLHPDGTIWCTELNVRLNGGSHFLQAAGVDHFANLLQLIKGGSLSFPTMPEMIKMTSWEVMHTFTTSPLRGLGEERASGATS